MGNANGVQRVTRIWRVPHKSASIAPMADVPMESAFRKGMHKPGFSWVVLRQDANGECRVYVDGTNAHVFNETSHVTSSGTFPLSDGSTGELTVTKNTSWVDTTWTYQYKLAVSGHQNDLVEVNSLTNSKGLREPAFLKASVTGHHLVKANSGEEYVAYEIAILVDGDPQAKVILRRYRDFALLSMCLKWAWQHHLHFSLETLPKLPGARNKDGGDKLDPVFIASRTQALEAYLAQVLKLPRVTENPDVLAFFEIVHSLDDICYYRDVPLEDDSRRSSMEECITLDEFETLLLARGQEPLDKLAEGTTRMTQEYLSQLASENPLQKVLKGALRLDRVNALLAGFERSRRNKNAFDEEDFFAWSDSQVPLLSDILKDRICTIRGKSRSRHPFPPTLDKASTVLTDESVKYLSAAFNECITCPSWTRLYANETDGLSFQTICTAVEGYDGPTLIVIQDRLGFKFGALATTRWKEDNSFYSSLSGALFSLDPVFVTYRRKSAAPTSNKARAKSLNNVQYLNARSKTLPLGMGFGGELHSRNSAPTAPHPRLWIDSEFDLCYATIGANDAVYDAGPLLGNDMTRDTFQIASIEVWGLGGADALQARAEWRRQTDRMIQKQRQVDKSQFANNGFDREYLLGETFNGNKREGNPN